MSPHVPQHQTRIAEAAPPRDYGSAHHVDSQDGRPELPRRNAQQHLVPQLMDTPGTRTPGGEDDVEPSMRNWTAFTGGFNRAEGSDESPSDGSR
jgi:hypothetical protein